MKTTDTGSRATDGEGLRVAIVRARFNDDLTGRMAVACRAELLRLGVAAADIGEETVPGALEIALALDTLAGAGGWDALVAIGCVIRGETYHFELVANESGAGITRVGLDHHLPIANAVLTVDDVAQAEARVEEKSTDAARVAVEMARLVQRLR